MSACERVLDASIYAVFISSTSPSPFLHDWGVPDAVSVSRPPSYSENCIYQIPWQVHHSDLPFPLLQPSYDDSAAWLHFRCRTHRRETVPLGEAFRRPMDAIGDPLTLSACAWNVRPLSPPSLVGFLHGIPADADVSQTCATVALSLFCEDDAPRRIAPAQRAGRANLTTR